MTGPHLGVLGPARVAGLPHGLGAKQRRLLAALAAHANRPVPADRLVDVLWGPSATAASAATLQSHVSRLRRHLVDGAAPVSVRATPGGYELVVAAEELDALLFERLLGRAHDDHAEDPAGRAAVLGRALDLWRGEAYADVAEHDVARGEAARLDELRVGADEERCEALVAAGRHAEAVGDLEALVRRHPLRERPRAALVLALYRSGRQADALDVYQDFRRTLADELGLDPSLALGELQRQVLERAPELDLPTVPEPRRPTRAPAGGAARVGGVPGAEAFAGAEGGRGSAPRGAGPAERKLVTVLVAGTTAAVSGDPDEAAEALDPLLTAVGDAVHRFGGSVTAVGADTVTAVFGVPVTTEDHAVRACRAAVEVLARAPASAAPPGIGVHSGEVIVGDLRSDLATAQGPVGPAVERAREAARAATPGTAVVSAETVHLAAGVVTAQPMEPAAGQPADAVRWCRLVAVAPLTTWEARARLGLSVLTGRDRELATLAAAVEQAVAGAGQVVALVGDPGVGKSRLVFETARSVPPGWTVLPCAASESGSTNAFGAVRTTVRLALGLGDRASGERVLEALRRVPGAGSDGETGPDTTAVAALLGADLGPGESGWVTLDPGVRRKRTVAAVVDVLLGRTAGTPVLLVVEDAHWLDGESVAVVEALADRAATERLLVLVTYRPEFRPGWQHRGHVQVVALEPLDEPDARSLAAALLGSGPGLEELADDVARRAGGVPLFIEETVRALADDGRLEGSPGAYRLTAAVGELGLPARVHGIVAARIDRLPPEQRSLLQAASVVGAEAPVSVLRDVVRGDPYEVEAALAGLLGSQLLYERRRGTQRRYVFKHALVREAARASLPRPRRRELHGRVVDVLGEGAPAERQDRLELLGHHAYEAGRWQLAAELLTVAGDRAQQRCAYREAAALLTRALEAQRRLPADPVAEVDLLIKLRPALHTVSEFDGAQAHLDRAEQLAAAEGDHRRLLLVELHRSYTMDTRGRLAGALEAGERALAIAQEVGDPLLAAEARMALGQAHAFAGDPGRALPLLRHDAALRRRYLRQERLGMGFNRPVFAAVLVAISEALLGRFDRAWQAADEAESLLATPQRPLDVSGLHLARGLIHLERGAVADAVPELAAAHELCLGIGVVMVAQWSQPRLGEALARCGRAEEARAHLAAALEQATERDAPLWRAWTLTGLGHLALAEGRPDGAAAHALELGTLADEWGYPHAGAVAARLAASAALATGDLAAAEAKARSAGQRAEAAGLRPERVRAELTLAAVLDRAGRSEEAAAGSVRACAEAAALGLADVADVGGTAS